MFIVNLLIEVDWIDCGELEQLPFCYFCLGGHVLLPQLFLSVSSTFLLAYMS